MSFIAGTQFFTLKIRNHFLQTFLWVYFCDVLSKLKLISTSVHVSSRKVILYSVKIALLIMRKQFLCWCIFIDSIISLRASSPFGGYRKKYTRECHARKDALALGYHARPNGEPFRRLLYFMRILISWQKWLKPGGELLLTDYCRGPNELSEAMKVYVAKRHYHLLSPADYGKVRGFPVALFALRKKFVSFAKNILTGSHF